MPEVKAELARSKMPPELMQRVMNQLSAGESGFVNSQIDDFSEKMYEV